ncbi:hypothetical protein LTR85_005733 [Meristemomyces frigidus]|nr:hypothetical protein LTR85_005733 [Meristemomyces frigidus]
MSTSNTPLEPAAGTLRRSDDAAIKNMSDRLLKWKNAAIKVVAEKCPGYHSSFVRELSAKFDEGLAYNAKLRTMTLNEVPDITVHPDALARRYPAIIFVDQPIGVCGMVDLISACHQRAAPTLDVSLDTEDDAVKGGLSIMQCFVHSANIVYILDMCALGKSAFNTPSSTGLTLTEVLESATIGKAFYGIAGDSYALYDNYGIRLAGITDLALMALACDGSKKKAHDVGLVQCVERCRKHFLFSQKEADTFKTRKEWAHREIFPETERKVTELRDAGVLEETDWAPLFNQRPLTKEVNDYVVWDVVVLPVVYGLSDEAIGKLKRPFEKLNDAKLEVEEAEQYAMLMSKKAKLGDKSWRELVEAKTADIIRASCTKGFDPGAREGKNGGLSEWSGLQS